ncbi:response regulator transcription factor [Micromonospora craniellae]|uniref:DNA-binding response regulator n=1 Tax=Micromonospora craniellae TaxID=2294034 RepID=A0A372G6E2_9ACTN|nr:LuxR C-terminal-related transcriptional regulator [Micromonospora craniellae]QOC90663.1 response regulator transcription factor [Micromonospora craniellae]RFS48494.1 DNA-binding response regulator [Micromonospora craniellae]
MSHPTHQDEGLVAAMKSLDEVLAHFQMIGELARDARDRLASACPEPLPVREPAPAAALPARQSVQLTRRQQQVLELLMQGVTNRRISRTLHITEQTVKAHLHMIYRKLGAADRTEAVVIAMRSTMVPTRPRADRPYLAGNPPMERDSPASPSATADRTGRGSAVR